MSACFCRLSVRKRPSSDFDMQLLRSSSETSASESTSLFPRYSSESGKSWCKSSQWKSAAEKVWKKLKLSLSSLKIRTNFTRLMDLSVWYRRFCLVPGIGAPKYNNFLMMRSFPVSTHFFSSSMLKLSALHLANTFPVVRAACLRSMLVATKVKQWWETNDLLSRNKCWKYCFLDGFLPNLGFEMSPRPSGKRSGNALEKNQVWIQTRVFLLSGATSLGSAWQSLQAQCQQLLDFEQLRLLQILTLGWLLTELL